MIGRALIGYLGALRRRAPFGRFDQAAARAPLCSTAVTPSRYSEPARSKAQALAAT
jgi:hypothetical protein